jgi:hypothetical protein
MNIDHLIWRLEHNQTAKALCKEAAEAIKFLRGGAGVARVAHNHEVAGSSPAPVTNSKAEGR